MLHFRMESIQGFSDSTNIVTGSVSVRRYSRHWTRTEPLLQCTEALRSVQAPSTAIQTVCAWLCYVEIASVPF